MSEIGSVSAQGATKPRRNIKGSHFHCYLLRSLDPRHPYKTYIGFTNNPHRRIRQHNGILKNGGAYKTRRSGRPWQFVVVVHGFSSQTTGLQFEWAWQHPTKSLTVRNAIGDPDAAALGRKRGIRGALSVLRTLVGDCEDFSKFSLDLHFLDPKWKNEFLMIVSSSSVTNNNNGGVKLPAGVRTCGVLAVDDMPFWEDCRKQNQKRSAVPISNSSSGIAPCTTCCFLCKRPSGMSGKTILCEKCRTIFHEWCMEEHVSKGAGKHIFPIQCLSCDAARLDWFPEEFFDSESSGASSMLDEFGKLDLHVVGTSEEEILAECGDSSYNSSYLGQKSKSSCLESSKENVHIPSFFEKLPKDNSNPNSTRNEESGFRMSKTENSIYARKVLSHDFAHHNDFISIDDQAALTIPAIQDRILSTASDPVCFDLTAEHCESEEASGFLQPGPQKTDTNAVIDLCDSP